jgi:hypothetical protein
MKQVFFLLSLISNFIFSQSVTNYNFSASSGSYTPLSGATTAIRSSGNNDEGAYNGIPIGFTFVYMGIPCSTVSLSTNGWMTFGQNLNSTTYINNLSAAGTRPLVAPLWDDLDMASGNVQYKTEGTEPNRIFTIQAYNVEWNYQASGGVISYQIKLYESSGVVQFVYNQQSVSVNNGSASIGITGDLTGPGYFLSLDGTGPSPNVSSTVETSSLNTKPASGQTYTFTPPASTPANPTSLSFSNIDAFAMTLNWVDNASSESAYLVYISTDNINFLLKEKLPANTNSYRARGLNMLTTYHWKIYAVNEGRISGVLNGSQATTSPSLSGTRTIGATGNYTSLTAAVTDVNDKGLSGALTLEFLSDYSGSEIFPIIFSNLTTTVSNTLTIRPASGVTGVVISGSTTYSIIRFENEDYITIDGRPGGSGTSNELTFRNTDSYGSTIIFINDASNNLIRNCNIEASTTWGTQAAVLFSTGTSTGNDNNIIQNCVIRDRSDASGVPANLIYSSGTSPTISNTNNSLLNNKLFNFTINGICLTNSGNDSWTITGNEIYQTANRSTHLTGINLNSLGSNIVSQNIIRDLNTSGETKCIYLDDVANITLSRNKIYNIQSTSGSTSTIYGIYTFGNGGNFRGRIHNNQITIIPSFTNNQTIYGIREWSDVNDSTYLYYNTVLIGGTVSGSSKSYAFDDNNAASHNVVYNNAFVNVRSGGTSGNFAARHSSISGITSTNSNNNLYIGNGPTSGNNFELSLSASSFSSWKSAFTGNGKDYYSYSVNSSDVNISNLFNDYTNGDLNIKNTNVECWLVNGKGLAVSGISDDYGNISVRNTSFGTSTDIGSDEFTPTDGGTIPPASTANAAPALNSTTSYTINGNTNLSIMWGNSGTVPTSVITRYYSGNTAPGTTGFQTANMYWDISVPDGSGYSYDIVLTYDENQLGSILETDLYPAKSNDGGTTWIAYTSEGTGAGQFQRNTSNNTITLYGMNSFSLFTLGDDNSPLPVELTSFIATVTKQNQVELNWQTATEINNYGFEIERFVIFSPSKNDNWQKIGFVKGNGNSNSPKYYSFIDQNPVGGKLKYRLKQIDSDGSFSYSNEIVVDVNIPKVFALEQNYPNPFNPITTISFTLQEDGLTTLKIYDLLGREVKTLVNEELKAGQIHRINFDGSRLASGVYFYKLESKNKSMIRKFVLMK